MHQQTIRTISQVHVDIETFSSVNLKRSGVYRYAESDDFQVLLFSYSTDGENVQVIDLTAGDIIPEEIVQAIKDSSVLKFAFNAQFERVCLSKQLGLPAGKFLDPTGWRCSMVLASVVGLPPALQQVSDVMKLKTPKLAEGERLIKRFSVPRSLSADGEHKRNLPEDYPNEWRLFKEYNMQDVKAEMEIYQRLQCFDDRDTLWTEYVLDQRINDAGILVDRQLAVQASQLSEQFAERSFDALQQQTGLANPNSTAQFKQWLQEQGCPMESLAKPFVAEKLQSNTLPQDVRRALLLRQQTAKTSNTKYKTMLETACADGRIRGLYRFYGAHTGRWSGQQVQTQNLPKISVEDIDNMRNLVLAGNVNCLESQSESVPSVLSQLIRTAFVASPGQKLIISDYSAIEARVLAWLAGETWRLKAFADGEDIYCASASQMFHVPVIKGGVNSELRAKGKIAELALGYGGGKGALLNMGALSYGLKEHELPDLVATWREANPRICALWEAVDQAASAAVQYSGASNSGFLRFDGSDGMLRIQLPSGRPLYYIAPRIELNDFQSAIITYMGYDQSRHKWLRKSTYGAKLVENIVQAVARDLLTESMTRLASYNIVMHVHDELVLDVPTDVSVEMIRTAMCTLPSWASDLPLNAEAFESLYYTK